MMNINEFFKKREKNINKPSIELRRWKTKIFKSINKELLRLTHTEGNLNLDMAFKISPLPNDYKRLLGEIRIGLVNKGFEHCFVSLKKDISIDDHAILTVKIDF